MMGGLRKGVHGGGGFHVRKQMRVPWGKRSGWGDFWNQKVTGGGGLATEKEYKGAAFLIWDVPRPTGREKC